MPDYRHKAVEYREQAAECRRHADQATDPFMHTQWTDMAEAYDQLAGRLDALHRQK
jgi:hypothetical protein